MKKCIGVLAAVFPLAAMAHPGHGETDGYTIIHYFSEPQHALVTLGAIILTLVFVLAERRKKKSE